MALYKIQQIKYADIKEKAIRSYADSPFNLKTILDDHQHGNSFGNDKHLENNLEISSFHPLLLFEIKIDRNPFLFNKKRTIYDKAKIEL